MNRINSLKTKIIGWSVIIMVFNLIGLGIISINLAQKSISKTAQKTLESMISDTATKIRHENEKEFTMIQGLAKLPFLQDENNSLKEKNIHINPMFNADLVKYENISFYDSEGFTYIMASDQMLPLGKGRDYFSEGMKGNPYVSDPLFSAVTNGILTFYSTPCYSLQNTSKIVGLVITVLKGARIVDIISEINIENKYYPIVVNMKSGNIIATMDDSLDLKKDIELAKIVEKSRSGKTEVGSYVDSITNEKMSYCFAPVGGHCDWAVLYSIPYDYYFGDLQVIKSIIAIVCVAAVIILFIVMTILISSTIKPLKIVEKKINEFATGNADLTKRIEVTSKNEIGEVVKGFNSFTEKLQSIISDIQKSKSNLEIVGSDLSYNALDTATAITQIISNIENVKKQILVQDSNVSETANSIDEISAKLDSLVNMIGLQSNGIIHASSAVEQMIGNINSVDKSVEKMAQKFNILFDNAESGLKKQDVVTEKIRQIEQESEMLQEANSVISGIAEQTNLLAMNAAIEAAHAGEAGKGFSVVADEIRKLSETATEQSKKIGDQLKEIMESIKGVSVASVESSDSFESVSKLIKETDEIVRQIKTAMNEQSEGSKQINQSLHTMNDTSYDVKTAGNQMSEGSVEIISKMRTLQQISQYLSESMKEMSIGATKINDSGVAIDEITKKVKASIDEISEQIDLFKV